jgi:inner membrane transporter RhtA
MGLSTAFMNMCFYQAIARIPLGSAVTIEFLGPLVVAVLGRHSRLNLLWALLGAGGVVLISQPGGGVTLVGALYALGSGVGWGGYVFASHRVGGDTPGFAGLAVAMSVSALATTPWALGQSAHLVHDPALVGRLLVVASLSIVAGFAAEMQALRLVKPSVVGVLLSFDPAVAFAVGVVGLHEHLTAGVGSGLVAVVVAGVGVTWTSTPPVAPREVG